MKVAAITRNLSAHCNYYTDFMYHLRRISNEITFYHPPFNSSQLKKDVDFIIVCFDILDSGDNAPSVIIKNTKEIPLFVIMNKEYAGLYNKLNWIKSINPTACFTVHHDNEKYANFLSIPVYRFSWSCDEELFKTYNDTYTHDLFFSGVLRKEQTDNMRKRVYDQFYQINDKYKLNIHVAIYENNKLIGDLYKFDNDEYAKLINNSKISLITTGPGDLVGTRYFEVSASNKSLIMCNRMPDQIYNKMMIDKFNCIMFEDEFDFIEKFKYYIEHEDERLNIVNNAYTYFNENLTWNKQMDNVIEKIKKHIC